MLTAKDEAKLEGIHKDLKTLVYAMSVFCPMPFTVLEGVRTEERQEELVAIGASQTMKSRHLTGHAVDLAPLVNGVITWDWKYYHPFAEHMKGAAALCGIDVDWGGDWKSFPDGPHWELSWDSYPIDTTSETEPQNV